MKNILKFLRKDEIGEPRLRKFQDEIGEPPWDYYFLLNLPESEYPKYLAKIFNYRTGEKLPLSHGVIDKKRCKTFNQKIQWLKLYGVTPLMRYCTDKVKVRDYVKEKIGEEYLKPVLQIIPNESKETMRCHCEQVNDNSGLARQSTDICQDTPDCHDTQKEVVSRNDRESNALTAYFDQIDFNKLPNSFVLKCNHGSKWQYIINNKEEFITLPKLVEIVKRQITGWLDQEYWVWNGFEMQYKVNNCNNNLNDRKQFKSGIEPKILIEKLLRDNNFFTQDLEFYCFMGEAKIIRRIYNNGKNEISVYDENLENINLKFMKDEVIINNECDKLTKQTFDLNSKEKELNKINEQEAELKISMKEILRLSEQLSKDFLFVRVDWIIFKNKFYFNELTFTPFSGFCNFQNSYWNNKLGNLIKLGEV